MNSAPLFAIDGNKLESLLMKTEGLFFLSKPVADVEAFEAAWEKKLSTANKIRIRYESIRSITKEAGEKTIRISYKTSVGIPSEVEFSFPNEADNEAFFDELVRVRYFVRNEGAATPFKAAVRYGLGFLFMALCTFVLTDRAADIEAGTADESTGGRGRLFDKLLQLLGVTGTWAVCGTITAYLLYKTISRFRNPPHQTRLLPPNS